MYCEQLKRLIHPYLDQQLDLSTILEMDTHLNTCPTCQLEYLQLKDLQQAVRQNMNYSSTPTSLRLSLMKEFSSTAEVSTQRKPKHFHALHKTLVYTAVFCLAFLLGWQVHTPIINSDLLDENVLTAHVRSLQVEHLTDVRSSDRHTVKPWFNGKLDFAPSVLDLSEHNFPLIGGRLDYLQDRPVTALVYGRRQHIINVFIWPDSNINLNIPPSSKTRNGFNLISFSTYGMQYYLISDLNMQEMQELEGLLKINPF